MKIVFSTRGHRASSFRLILQLCGLLGLMFLGAGCSSTSPGSSGSVGHGIYYAQFGVRIEREACRSTNYRLPGTSVLIPINSEVELLSSKGNRFRLSVVGGQEFTFEHVPKHSRNQPAESFASFFGATPVDFTGFSDEDLPSILAGEVREGMSRSAVLAAIGPPPAVETPELESEVWKYWNTRWNTFTVTFGDGRVSGIAD